MSWFSALILGFIQGLTEFLPVSSSGHLNLAQYFFRFTPSLSFDIFLNTATLLSVLVFFRGQVKYFFNHLGHIFIATLPAVFVGFFFKDQISYIFSSVKFLPFFFLITSFFLFATRLTKHKSVLTYKQAFIIGLVQTLSLLPGVSRSGVTIATALLLGLNPLEAFNFSFCLFIPASLGALLLDLPNLSLFSLTPPLIVSFLVTFLVGLCALYLLRRAVRQHTFWYFGLYTLVLSILLCLLFYFR